jgi:DNA-binding Lrp family transcriptional regulator
MKKIVAVSTYDKIIKDMCESVDIIEADYNHRDDDSIHIPGFKLSKVEEVYTKDIVDDLCLTIDIRDRKKVKRAIKELLKEENSIILECSTFIQSCFFYSLMKNIQSCDMKVIFREKKSYDFKIYPMNTKPVDKKEHLHFDDFFRLNFLENKLKPEQMNLCVGDVIYVENYDSYPTENNGAYAGEYCVVLDTKYRNDPLLFGFGMGTLRYLEAVKILRDSYIEEVFECTGEVVKKGHKPKGRIGIQCQMRLDYYMFSDEEEV